MLCIGFSCITSNVATCFPILINDDDNTMMVRNASARFRKTHACKVVTHSLTFSKLIPITDYNTTANCSSNLSQVFLCKKMYSLTFWSFSFFFYTPCIRRIPDFITVMPIKQHISMCGFSVDAYAWVHSFYFKASKEKTGHSIPFNTTSHIPRFFYQQKKLFSTSHQLW